MSEIARTLRPQEAIDIAQTINAAIDLITVWTHALQLVDQIYQPIEIMENHRAALAVSSLRDALRRNPPQQALDILAKQSELHEAMDELDRTAGTSVPVSKAGLDS